MKFSLSILTICLLAACRNVPATNSSFSTFEKLVPDTTKSSMARDHYRNYYAQTRRIENRLHLNNLENGTAIPEVRLWLISGSFDSQVLFVLRQENKPEWRLRVIQYEASKSDSIRADYSVYLSDSLVNIFQLNQFWNIPSQSEMKDGLKFGCMDGFVTLLEMADSKRYKYISHVCPDINKGKDSAFYKVNLLLDQLDGASVQHW